MECKVIINNQDFKFNVEGDFHQGKGGVLFNSSYLTGQSNQLSKKGFDVFKILEEPEFSKLYKSIEANINSAIEKSLGINNYNGGLEDYHKIVTTNEEHNKVTSVTKNFTNEHFNFDLELIVKRIGDLLNLKLSSFNPELGRSHVQLRISRPDNLDINPPHRDGYLTYYKNVINLWIPISGCNNQSILPVVSESHLYDEENLQLTSSQGAKINGNRYIVPCILNYLNKPFNMIRPELNYGDALVFTPYLIHGAAINLGNKTRMSLELRLTILEK